MSDTPTTDQSVQVADERPDTSPTVDAAADTDAVFDTVTDTDAAPQTVNDSPAGRRFDLLRDVDLEITVELGRTHMAVKDVLSVAPGTVIELDRVAGSPADILVNGTPIARGKVVVIDDEYAIRVSEIITTDS